MSKYILMNSVNGRYYVSSNAKIVDPYDINFAKVFPTIRSAKAAMQWFNPSLLNTDDPDVDNWYYETFTPKIYEVELKITLGNEVEK